MLSLDINFLNRDFAPVHLQLSLGTYSQASSSVPRPQDSIKEFIVKGLNPGVILLFEFIIRKLNTLVVVDFRFISAF